MSRCMKPFTTKQGLQVPCGKCYDCKNRRISGWSFRLLQEAKKSTSALFVTLTYDTEQVPISNNGFMSLEKADVQNFFKRLRHHAKDKKKRIKYYAAAEYGGKTKRPHYHAIIFNAKEQDIEKAWTKGQVHIGQLSPASAAYTLKYISKGKTTGKFERDDRVSEFSLMSKKLGINYLSDKIKAWYKADMENRYYVPIEDGKKIALPRYYKEKLFTKEEREIIGKSLFDKELKKLQELSYEQAIAKVKHDEALCEYKEKIKNKDNRKTSI